MRDSAGVRIVELDASGPAAERAWHIDELPTLTIGTIDGGAETAFVRIRGVERAEDGALYILDPSIGVVRVFEADGAFRRSIGRRGNGPGEFLAPLHMWLGADDSLFVWDAQYGPLSVFDAQGGLIRTRVFDRATLVQMLGEVQPYEGAIPVDGSSFVVPSRPPAEGAFVPPRGPYRPPLEMMLVRADADTAVHLGTYHGVSQQWLDAPGEPAPIILPFWRHYQIATSAKHGLVALGDADRYEIRVHANDGTMLRILRRPDGPWRRGPGAAELAAEKAGRLAETSPDLQAWRARVQDDAEDPALFPAHGRLLFDHDGNLWVEEYPTPADTTGRWMVYAPDGTPLALAVVPAGLTLHEVGAAYVAGVRRDALDVESVAVHRLEARDVTPGVRRTANPERQ